MSEILNSLNINGAFFEFLNDKLKHYEKNQKSKLESLEKVLQSLKNQDANILNSFEENLEKILNAKNLEELLNILIALNEDKMIKVYEDSYLKEKFPNVMVDQFLK
ncbi:hypothetical protein C7M97_04955 [Campylobacter jejuni]|nr:hypothetical protein [Campylobacter jejuni]